MNPTIGIVAHTTRAEQAHQLMETVGAAYISIDNGTLGCEGNHRKVWQWLNDHATTKWVVVLEDDAQPIPDFTQQLGLALESAPTPIVSLYLGKKRPPHWQSRIQAAITQADRVNAHYLTAPSLIHAVALAMKTDLIPALLAATRETPPPWDYTLGAWARTEVHPMPISYTWPSLCDHADQDTVAHHPDNQQRTPGRKAWRTGTRTHWTTQVVTL